MDNIFCRDVFDLITSFLDTQSLLTLRLVDKNQEDIIWKYIKQDNNFNNKFKIEKLISNIHNYPKLSRNGINYILDNLNFSDINLEFIMSNCLSRNYYVGLTFDYNFYTLYNILSNIDNITPFNIYSTIFELSNKIHMFKNKINKYKKTIKGYNKIITKKEEQYRKIVNSSQQRRFNPYESIQGVNSIIKLTDEIDDFYKIKNDNEKFVKYYRKNIDTFNKIINIIIESNRLCDIAFS